MLARKELKKLNRKNQHKLTDRTNRTLHSTTDKQLATVHKHLNNSKAYSSDEIRDRHCRRVTI